MDEGYSPLGCNTYTYDIIIEYQTVIFSSGPLRSSIAHRWFLKHFPQSELFRRVSSGAPLLLLPTRLSEPIHRTRYSAGSSTFASNAAQSQSFQNPSNEQQFVWHGERIRARVRKTQLLHHSKRRSVGQPNKPFKNLLKAKAVDYLQLRRCLVRLRWTPCCA